MDAFTGHTNGCMGQSTRIGVLPSHPAWRNVPCAYSGGFGSKVHAVSVPNSVGMPRRLNNFCDSTLRVITSESRTYRAHIFSIMRSMCPASPPYASDNLFSAEARPSEPIIIVVRAFANLLLNIEPSHAITPWFARTSRYRNGGNRSGKCTWRVPAK